MREYTSNADILSSYSDSFSISWSLVADIIQEGTLLTNLFIALYCVDIYTSFCILAAFPYAYFYAYNKYMCLYRDTYIYSKRGKSVDQGNKKQLWSKNIPWSLKKVGKVLVCL